MEARSGQLIPKPTFLRTVLILTPDLRLYPYHKPAGLLLGTVVPWEGVGLGGEGTSLFL